MDIKEVLQKLWGKTLLTSIGLLMIGLSFMKLFSIPSWYYVVAGGFLIAGTIWWAIDQARR